MSTVMSDYQDPSPIISFLLIPLDLIAHNESFYISNLLYLAYIDSEFVEQILRRDEI